MTLNRLLSRSLPAVIGLIIALLFTAAASAATLHDRSLPLLDAKVQAASPDDFTFVVLGDSRDNDEVFRRILALAKTFKPVFILHNGDTVWTGNEAELDHFLDLVGQDAPEIPLFVVVGNHEIGRRGTASFEERIGPLHFTIDIPRLNLKVVAVNNALHKLSPSELRYLDGELAEGRRFNFLAMHVPPATPRWKKHNFTKGADGLIRIMAQRRPAMAFFSHMHLYDEDTVAGVPSFVTGGAGAPLRDFGLGEPFHHLLVITIKDGNVSHRVVRLPK